MKIIILAFILTGCAQRVEVEGFWIKEAQNVCETSGGLYSLFYSTNPEAFKMQARCNNGALNDLSK